MQKGGIQDHGSSLDASGVIDEEGVPRLVEPFVVAVIGEYIIYYCVVDGY